MVYLPYAYIRPIETKDTIRMASTQDISAMKLSAIARRGVKKDFRDIYELLEIYSIDQML